MPKSKSEPDQFKCKLVLCEDPATGQVLVKADGPCPPGYMEKVRDQCQKDGITFVIPKVKTQYEE